TFAARAPVAQLDRASASGAEGYRFDPCRAHSPLSAVRRPRGSAGFGAQRGEQGVSPIEPGPGDRFKPNARREMASMFDDVSRRYDLLNSVMTLGQDVAWREVMWRSVPAGARTVLDLCTGSGASLSGLRRVGRTVLGIDVSLGMLRVAAA